MAAFLHGTNSMKYSGHMRRQHSNQSFFNICALVLDTQHPNILGPLDAAAVLSCPRLHHDAILNQHFSIFHRSQPTPMNQ